MNYQKRLSVSLYSSVLKIGLTELLYALNFSYFTYHKVLLNPFISYPLVLVTNFVFYYTLSYLAPIVGKLKRPRVTFSIVGTILLMITLLSNVLLGYGSNLKDISTITSLLVIELLADFSFGYSLYYAGMVKFQS